MDFGFFHDFLSIDSTSGKERKVAGWLSETLPGMFPAANRPVLRVDEVGDGTLNLLLSWGEPRIVFCSHLDTVPPYIPPTFLESVIKGRGSCDAKGQVFAMATACQRLAEEGKTDFGLLLLAGEETGSWGAKAFAKTDFRAPYLVVGEPTDNCMVSASKGTKSFDLKFTGEAFHSGYPQYGVSAVDLFVDFVNQLRAKDFGLDPVLGETTWNIGLVHSDNPQNILSPELTCRLYFRTTFVSDDRHAPRRRYAGDVLDRRRAAGGARGLRQRRAAPEELHAQGHLRPGQHHRGASRRRARAYRRTGQGRGAVPRALSHGTGNGIAPKRALTHAAARHRAQKRPKTFPSNNMS